MIVVDKTNLDSAPAKNLKEILDLNSSSVDVKSVYSKNSTLPIITYSLESRQASNTITRSSTPAFVVTVDINCLDTVFGSAMDLRGVIRNLIDAQEETFSQYNMTLHDVRDNYTPVQRGEGRIHNAILIVQFVVMG